MATTNLACHNWSRFKKNSVSLRACVQVERVRLLLHWTVLIARQFNSHFVCVLPSPLDRQQDDYVGPSFATIAGSGPNGAVIHYESSEHTNRPITTEEMFLLDTGAQFRDGTTDITRTIHLGSPSSHEKECFTRVVKGHISLALAKFPKLIKGEFLDSFARRALWEVGLDYNHGTGHGVGMFLNVHEGPMGISNRVSADDPGLQENMVLSNEPGYYEAGKFGIRIESLVVTKEVNLKVGSLCDCLFWSESRSSLAASLTWPRSIR